jgi:hypothetical protein
MTSFAKYLLAAVLIGVGIIHLIPITGVAGVERLRSLYGIGIDDRNLSILLRHRAVLFGLLGLFLVYAAFKPPLQFPALVAGAVSVASFLLLAYSTGGFNEELKRVVVADIIAAVGLAIGFLVYIFLKSRS